MPEGLARMRVEFDESHVVKTSRLNAQGLPARTGTQLKSSQIHNCELRVFVRISPQQFFRVESPYAIDPLSLVPASPAPPRTATPTRPASRAPN